MLKIFVKGIVFGVGFLVAVGLIGYIFALINVDKKVMPSEKSEILWHNLTDDQKISESTVLAVARYSDAEDGSKIATIAEIYKDNPDIDFDYKVGENYQSLKYYPKSESHKKTGVVIFFAGSPPKYRHALYLYDDRVSGFGEMPLNVLIKKFKQDA
jgi:hypothetical protein